VLEEATIPLEDHVQGDEFSVSTLFFLFLFLIFFVFVLDI
jgi:hypothetical protein